MADIETVSSGIIHGYAVYFSKSETESIADALSAGSVAASFIPDPVISKIAAAGGAILAIVARRAVRNDKKLGLRVMSFPTAAIIPFTYK